jgi:hypothetical protein
VFRRMRVAFGQPCRQAVACRCGGAAKRVFQGDKSGL